MPYKDIEKHRESSRRYYKEHRQERALYQQERRKKLRGDKKSNPLKYPKSWKGKYKKDYWHSYLKRPAVQLKRKLSQKKFKETHRDYWSEYYKKRKTRDYKFHIDCNMSSIISTSLKKRKNWRKWQNLVGYTLEDLITHLEKQFDEKMNWNNYGSYWWREDFVTVDKPLLTRLRD